MDLHLPPVKKVSKSSVNISLALAFSKSCKPYLRQGKYSAYFLSKISQSQDRSR